MDTSVLLGQGGSRAQAPGQTAMKPQGQDETYTWHKSAKNAALRERHSSGVVCGFPVPRMAATTLATVSAASGSSGQRPSC